MSHAPHSLASLPGRLALAAALAASALVPATLAAQGQPSQNMNFFVAPTGPTVRPGQPALPLADQLCGTLAYAQGFGQLQWRAYLNEGSQVARNRIGSGPWYNYYGVPIAENLAQLHSDDNNLWAESAVTVTGEYAPQGFVIPVGSQLDGGDFTARGPFLCFGVS